MMQPLAVGTLLKDRYRVVRLVGGGGMARVYQAEDVTETGAIWAVKELHPQTEDKAERALAEQMFEQEALLLQGLNQENIPKIADFFSESGRAYLVMEFILGESLEKRLEAARSPLLESDVLGWAVQLCDALDYLHARRPPVIFRDLKPSNVMVTHAGQIKLIDFGIARTYKQNKARDTVAMGSENYAAPEQFGQEQTDARSDIYALGATLYHLLANLAPTPAFLPSEPLPLPTYNPAVSAATVTLIQRAMQRRRQDRFQSVAEMRAALLDSWLGPGLPASAPAAATLAADPGLPSTSSPGSSPASLPVPGPAGRSQEAMPGPVVHHRDQAPSQPPQICPACNKANRPVARFCVACGCPFGPLGSAVLRVVEPVRAAWEMPVRSPLLLGRASEAEDYRPGFDMTFYDEGGYVSRRHARITRGSGGYFVTDLESSNGTTVNSRPLQPLRAHPLRNGDRVQIGLVVIQFYLR